MKEVIIDIITKRKEIDIKEINEDEDYKNEGVDQLVKSFQKILPEFLKLQDELSKISNDFEKEMIEIKKHMTIIDAQIEYLRKLPNDYNDDESMKGIIDQMRKYRYSKIHHESGDRHVLNLYDLIRSCFGYPLI